MKFIAVEGDTVVVEASLAERQTMHRMFAFVPRYDTETYAGVKPEELEAVAGRLQETMADSGNRWTVTYQDLGAIMMLAGSVISLRYDTERIAGVSLDEWLETSDGIREVFEKQLRIKFPDYDK